MTDSLQKVLMRILAAAIFCSVIKCFHNKSSVTASIIKTLCGIFMTTTILSTLLNFKFSSISDNIDAFSVDAENATQAGTLLYDTSMHDSIKQQTEAYILDKAASIKADISVEVTLSDGNPPVPCSVVLDGQVSPFAKSKLTKLISDDLGISKENQIWR